MFNERAAQRKRITRALRSVENYWAWQEATIRGQMHSDKAQQNLIDLSFVTQPPFSISEVETQVVQAICMKKHLI